ncbi:hypothetical protein [Sphingomonas sp. PAMC 26605]|uniref:hypothetical protein n=1 Tax=Sphingomonas sp. PAMC 26605 TaxID=1112214 RepID=UPI00026CD833|nr:hypothetical protein [Sphingomonas sp. PAMC 26605]
MPSHPGKGHAFPYFKVQVRDQRSLAWKDHRKEAFDDEASARAYQATLDPYLTSRVTQWDESGSRALDN